MVIHCKEKFSTTEEKYQEYFNCFPYTLSDFQKWAIFAIVNGHHSLVTAHTGSGKTVPAEFAIDFFKSQGKKVIYTAPIKALCNQKLYDLKLKFPNITFGILTGDIKDNPEADVLIMTTEILRNTLFNKKINSKNTDTKPIELQFELDIDTELGAVVFDEVHYIGDQDRGSVWEQSILLLPEHVQLIMLSATIEKPEVFAQWLENEKNKEGNTYRHLYLMTTYERVVPLTHYAWLTAQSSIIQGFKGTSMEYKCKDIINKPVILAKPNGEYSEQNYHKINKLLGYFQTNKIYIKRQFVLNQLISYLHRNDMLPAICFVFSRKNVEFCAKEITISLFGKDDKTPSIIENECQKILMNKLKNYKEYVALEEYRTMISLLRKGIAIHHAGIMPILREMVELLFEKKYIKLLFATETFAVGLNMPTKTVIFSSVSKFSGTGMRYLLPHEYTQMAGRAGRRGLDTIGHVIHCNNLFTMPDSNTYCKMLTGPPKMLTSQFKIGFNLVLNIISVNNNDIDKISDQLITFMEKSFIKNDIIKEINAYDSTQRDLEREILELDSLLKNGLASKIPVDILYNYFELTNSVQSLGQKQRKKVQKDIHNLETEYKNIKKDVQIIVSLKNCQNKLEENNGFKLNALNYIQTNIDTIQYILNNNEFIKDNVITTKGTIAMHLQEVHSLALADLYENFNKFAELSAIELVGLFSCFSNISIPNDQKSSIPLNPHLNPNTKKYATRLNDYITKYYDIESDHQLDTGTNYEFHFEIIDEIINWCNASNEFECINLINTLKSEREIFLGEFIKAILKINNIAKEFEKICEILNNLDLLQKIKKIPELTLKYVATNQSLYI